jgi:hypothetical protein
MAVLYSGPCHCVGLFNGSVNARDKTGFVMVVAPILPDFDSSDGCGPILPNFDSSDGCGPILPNFDSSDGCGLK